MSDDSFSCSAFIISAPPQCYLWDFGKIGGDTQQVMWSMSLKLRRKSGLEVDVESSTQVIKMWKSMRLAGGEKNRRGQTDKNGIHI